MSVMNKEVRWVYGEPNAWTEKDHDGFWLPAAPAGIVHPKMRMEYCKKPFELAEENTDDAALQAETSGSETSIPGA